MLPRHREKVFDLNVKGTRIVMEESLAAGVERVVFTSSVAAIGPAKPRGTADESQPFRAGALGIAYVNSKHEAEVEALRLAAHGLPVVIVNPSFVLGPDDPKGRRWSSCGASCWAASRRTSTAASTSSTSATSRRATCSRTRRASPGSATSSRRATSRSTGSSPTWRASRAASMPR